LIFQIYEDISQAEEHRHHLTLTYASEQSQERQQQTAAF